MKVGVGCLGRVAVSGGDVLANNARHVAGDAACAMGLLVGITTLAFERMNAYNSSRAGRLRPPPMRHWRSEVVSAWMMRLMFSFSQFVGQL